VLIAISVILFSSYLFFKENAPVLLPISIWLGGIVPFTATILFRKRIKFINVLGILSFMIFLLCLEIGFRFPPFDYSFLPYNTGKDLTYHPLLLWKEKPASDHDAGLAKRGIVDSMSPAKSGSTSADFIVTGEDPLHFRSGKASMTKEKRLFRIITMGGSSTWGYGIERYEDTFSGLLETMINEAYPDMKIEIIWIKPALKKVIDFR